MIVGDVFAIVAFLVGACITTWALMVSCVLLFPVSAQRAAASIERYGWGNVGLGLAVLVPGLIGLVMTGQPLPLVKTLGLVIVLAVLGVGAVGASGLGLVAGKRLQRLAPEMGDYPAFVRGSGFLVTAAMLPLLGWFAFAPLFLLAAFGSGSRAVLHRTVRPPIVAGVV